VKGYFLFIVGSAFGDFVPGDCGVGETDLSPGIKDGRHGILYVIPREYIDHSCPGAYTIKRCVKKYYGMDWW